MAKENKKARSKLLIIVAIIIILLIVTVVSVLVLKNNNSSTGTEWGDSYYTYLKSAIKENNNKEDYGLKDNMENTNIQFIEVGESNPVMVMTYDYEGDSYVNIYTTEGENQVDKVVYQNPATIDFLYDIQNKSYDWYLHTENETEDLYNKIYTILKKPEQNNEAEYTIVKDDVTTQDTVSGETITLPKFDEIFIRPEIESTAKIDFTQNINPKNLKISITNIIEKFRNQEELITEEIKKAIENKIAEIEEIKQQIESAKAEIAQKVAEETKKKEEETKKNLQDEKARKVIEEGKKIYENSSKVVSEANNTLSETEKAVFNAKFTCYEGATVRGSNVKALINVITAHNQNNGQNRQVSLSGNIQQLTDVSSAKTYNVKCNYGSDGFIKSISINNN